MAGKVDVLAVIGDAAEVLGRDGYTSIPNDLIAASAQVSELIAAATEVRDAAWGPGKTDQPHILRLDAALSNMEAR